MRFLLRLVVTSFFILSWQTAYGGENKREIECSNSNAKLTRYVSDAMWPTMAIRRRHR